MGDDLTETLDTLERNLSALSRQLMDEDMLKEAVMAADDYLAADGETGDTVAEMFAWVRDNTDADIDDLEAVGSQALTDTDAEGFEDITVGEMQTLVQEMLQDGDDEDGEEMAAENEPPEDSDDDGPNMQDLEAVKETLGQFADHMGDIKDMLQARDERREQTLEELERRLSEVENEPVERSLTGQQPTEFVDGDDADGDVTDGEHDEVML